MVDRLKLSVSTVAANTHRVPYARDGKSGRYQPFNIEYLMENRVSYWVIKHTPTGAYFPLSSRGGKRGSTYISLPFLGVPRLFTKPNAAKVTLDWWLKGAAKSITDSDGDRYYSVGAEPGNGDPARKSEEFEIIKIEIKE